MLIFWTSSSPVLVMISSMSIPICNHFHARQANSEWITIFRGVPLFDTCVRRPFWTYRVRTWTAEIYIWCWKFHVQVVSVCLQPFRRNLLLKCVSQLEIAKNSLKPSILGVQGYSRSLMLTFLRSSTSVLVATSSMSVPICNHFHAIQANKRCTPFWHPGAQASLNLEGPNLDC